MAPQPCTVSPRMEGAGYQPVSWEKTEVHPPMARTLLISFVFLALALQEGRAQEKLFSGPQVGEKLPPFKVRGFFDDNAGKELDFVKQAAGKPIVLVFIHDVNRM